MIKIVFAVAGRAWQAAASRPRPAQFSRALAAAMLVVPLFCASAFAQFAQQGQKLVGPGGPTGGIADFGISAALSNDGNTAAVGAPGSTMPGATVVFTRSGGVWTQQGSTLVGTRSIGSATQGDSVALSADGNTLIVGGTGDNNTYGAAWVFVRKNGVWTQQAKLMGDDTTYCHPDLGSSVALSADGNTAIVGGFYAGAPYHCYVGEALVFTRADDVWTLQASLVGSDYVGYSAQGDSVALSADGNTAAVGGSGDNDGIGAVWVFTRRPDWRSRPLCRTCSVWTQQGSKLVGTDVLGSESAQGISVALSAAGDTLLVGGDYDNDAVGAAWVFTRSAGTWSQQAKLVGSDYVGPPVDQGWRLALSGDGNTAVIGGYYDNDKTGAVWVFTRSNGAWSQQGSKLDGSDAQAGPCGPVPCSAEQGLSVAVSGDGSTLLEGGPYDDDAYGAAWVFVDGSSPRLRPGRH